MTQTRRAMVSGTAGAAGAASAGVLLAACGAPGATGSGGAAPGKFTAPVTVRYLMWASTSTVEQAQIKTLADKLTAKEPNLTVELTMGSAQFDDQLLAMYSGGTPPDTWQASSDNYKGYIAKDMLYDLAPFTRRDSSDFGDIYPFLTSAYRYKNGTYGWPFGGGTVVLYYNKALYQREGLADPNDLAAQKKWDFTALLDAARRTTKKDASGAVTQWGLSTIGYWQPWIWAAGGELFDAGITKALLDQPRAIEGMQFEADLYARHGVAALTDAQRGGQNGFLAFDQGLGAAYLHGTWQIDDRRKNASFAWDIAPFPAGPRGDRATISPPGSIGISKPTKVADATWEWLKAYLGRDAARGLLIETGSIAGSKQTMYKGVMSDPRVLAALKANPQPAHFDVFLAQQLCAGRAQLRAPGIPPGGRESRSPGPRGLRHRLSAKPSPATDHQEGREGRLSGTPEGARWL
jgi:multiple sugar transport system substrate-binding protein